MVASFLSWLLVLSIWLCYLAADNEFVAVVVVVAVAVAVAAVVVVVVLLEIS